MKCCTFFYKLKDKLKLIICFFISNTNLFPLDSIYKIFQKYYFTDIGSSNTLNIKFEYYKYKHLKPIFKNLSQEEIMYLNVFLNNVTSEIPELKKRQNIIKEFVRLIENKEIDYNRDFLFFNNPYFDILLDVDIENITNKQVTTRLQRLGNLIKKMKLIIEIIEKNDNLLEMFEKEVVMFYNLIEGNTNDDLLNLTIDYIKRNRMKEEFCAKNYTRKKYVKSIINNYDYLVKIIYHLSKIMFYLKISYNVVNLREKIQFVNFKKNINKKFLDKEKEKIYNDVISESYTIIFPRTMHDDVILKHLYKSIDNIPFKKNKLRENAFLGLVFGFAIL